MTELTLDIAGRIVDLALAKGREMKLAPLAVALLDARGIAKCLKAEDGTSLLRVDIASAKAWGALGMGFGTRTLAERAVKAPQFFGALQNVSGGRIVPAAGGVLIRAADRALLGAIGISGDNSDNDEACAVWAIQQVGLIADPGGA